MRQEQINVPLLLEVKAAILANPQHFDITGWFEFDYDAFCENDLFPAEFLLKSLTMQHCGTTACISGWAVALAVKNGDAHATTSPMNGELVLNLNGKQRRELFLRENWPEPFRIEAYRAETSELKASIAADRIDAFIAQYAPEAAQLLPDIDEVFDRR